MLGLTRPTRVNGRAMNAPGTREACGFRDAYEAFLAAGAEVIGVSGDTAERHRRFAEAQRLSFPLVSDADGSLRRAFAVPRTLGIFPGRVTYVIDKQGVVRHVFSGQFAAERHVAEALAIVRTLADEAAPEAQRLTRRPRAACEGGRRGATI